MSRKYKFHGDVALERAQIKLLLDEAQALQASAFLLTYTETLFNSC